MNNWRRFKEKLTIWVIRFSTEARLKYWGLTNLTPQDAKNVVGLLQASCLLNHPIISSAGLVRLTLVHSSAIYCPTLELSLGCKDSTTRSSNRNAVAGAVAGGREAEGRG